MADNIKRVKVILTGYYEVNMNDAENDYGTTDPTEMLAIDIENAVASPEVAIDWLSDTPEIVLSWEN